MKAFLVGDIALAQRGFYGEIGAEFGVPPSVLKLHGVVMAESLESAAERLGGRLHAIGLCKRTGCSILLLDRHAMLNSGIPSLAHEAQATYPEARYWLEEIPTVIS
ncbi:MAG: hypothetical protein HYW90_03515 [Candidatus Sungbacteria bacterium]|nr:hypothetical protein [Candidatus Sungbacteria bacterium]